MKVVLAGGTGALGRRIADDLASRGDDVVLLSRNASAQSPHRIAQWDGASVGRWADELRGAVVINLAGELVDRRPSARNIALLTKSRVEPTSALAAAAAQLDEPPTVWIQMSTLAIYGNRGDEVLDEAARPGDGPPQMAGVAKAWEAAAADIAAARKVVLRTGIVLDRGTPALNRLSGLVRWRLGGRVGSGRQWVSWLHADDFLGAVRFAVADQSMSGVVHATSPNPVRNAELMAALRKVLHRSWAPPTPALLAKVGAVFLRTDAALALFGRRAVPTVLEQHGFEFQFSDVELALVDLLRGGRA